MWEAKVSLSAPKFKPSRKTRQVTLFLLYSSESRWVTVAVETSEAAAEVVEAAVILAAAAAAVGAVGASSAVILTTVAATPPTSRPQTLEEVDGGRRSLLSIRAADPTKHATRETKTVMVKAMAAV